MKINWKPAHVLTSGILMIGLFAASSCGSRKAGTTNNAKVRDSARAAITTPTNIPDTTARTPTPNPTPNPAPPPALNSRPNPPAPNPPMR